MNFLTLPEAPGLLVDGLLTAANDKLLFLSAWGRDTAVQALLARMSLPSAQDGFVGGSFHCVADGGTSRLVVVNSANRLTHTSGRAPSYNLFGEGLTHAWVYDELAQTPDRAKQRALLFSRTEIDLTTGEPRLWRLVQDTCSVPLLPHWNKPVLRAFSHQGWIRALSGHNLWGYEIVLGPTKVEACIRTMVRSGVLRESADAPTPIPTPFARRNWP